MVELGLNDGLEHIPEVSEYRHSQMQQRDGLSRQLHRRKKSGPWFPAQRIFWTPMTELRDLPAVRPSVTYGWCLRFATVESVGWDGFRSFAAGAGLIGPVSKAAVQR